MPINVITLQETWSDNETEINFSAYQTPQLYMRILVSVNMVDVFP